MTIIRLLLISTFFLDFENVNEVIIESTQISIVLLMMFIYIGSIIIGVISLSIEIITNIFKRSKSETTTFKLNSILEKKIIEIK